MTPGSVLGLSEAKSRFPKKEEKPVFVLVPGKDTPEVDSRCEMPSFRRTSFSLRRVVWGDSPPPSCFLTFYQAEEPRPRGAGDAVLDGPLLPVT